MVWDVDQIVFFHQTTQKEKVLSLLLAINREDNVPSTTTSLQVQHGQCRAPAADRDAERKILVWFWHRFFFFFFFFFLIFSQKATRAGDEKHRKKKSAWPNPD